MRVAVGLSFPSCGVAASGGESSVGLAMEAGRQQMGGVGWIRRAFGQRRLDLATKAARQLVERLGGPSASATSSFPPPRGVGGQSRSEGGARQPVLAAQAAGFGGVGRWWRRRRVVEHVGAA
jgi:hypothetical protein